MTVNQFLEAIKNEKRGFKFGRPWRYSKDSLFAVLPVIRKSRAQRNYITLSEAKKAKIKDSGQINKIFITNGDKQPIFIRAGEIFKGQTQERAAVMSRIIIPKETVEVDVVCVHQTRGIATGAKMSSLSGGLMTYTPSSVEEKLYVDRGDQSGVWGSVAAYSMQATAMNRVGETQAPPAARGGAADIITPSDDLIESMKTFSKSIGKVIKAVPKLDWQTGLILISVDGVEAIECFDLPDSWTAVHKAIISKENETLAKYLEDKDSIFEFKSEKVQGIAKKIFRLDFAQKDLFKDKNGKTIQLKKGSYIGEATLFKNKVIHLALTRKKN